MDDANQCKSLQTFATNCQIHCNLVKAVELLMQFSCFLVSFVGEAYMKQVFLLLFYRFIVHLKATNKFEVRSKIVLFWSSQANFSLTLISETSIVKRCWQNPTLEVRSSKINRTHKSPCCDFFVP